MRRATRTIGRAVVVLLSSTSLWNGVAALDAVPIIKLGKDKDEPVSTSRQNDADVDTLATSTLQQQDDKPPHVIAAPLPAAPILDKKDLIIDNHMTQHQQQQQQQSVMKQPDEIASQKEHLQNEDDGNNKNIVAMEETKKNDMEEEEDQDQQPTVFTAGIAGARLRGNSRGSGGNGIHETGMVLNHENVADDCGGPTSATPERCVHHSYYAAGDLGIRFNKFDFVDPSQIPDDWTNLIMKDYPVQGVKADVLKHHTMAVSVVTQDDYQFQQDSIMTAHEYIMRSGGYPSMPNRDPNHAFWTELEEVVDIQIVRRQGDIDPNDVFRLPDIWKEWSIAEVGEAVHDEYPGFHQANMLSWLLSQKPKLDPEIFPFRSRADFIGSVIRSSFLNSWSVAEVGPIAFYTKWAVGRPRPEEIAYMIALDELTAEDGVPEQVVEKVKSMELTSPESFTQYPEGSPKHPAWPAMHSAGSTSSFWLRIMFNLTEEQYCQALLTDYAVAMARTVAGVHYRMDNICGLNMGQQIIAERLADTLAEVYGSDRAAVQAKIDKERFDWENFDPLTCERS